jgi:general secretion pathway protein D
MTRRNRFLPTLGLTGTLLFASLAGPAQAAGETPARTAPSAAKGASAPLQAAQQPAPAAAATGTDTPSATTAAPAVRPGEVLLNFQAAEIQAVIKAMSQMTGRNFLLDPRVKGQITIISARPVSMSAAYQIFLSALKAQGFTAVEGIGVVRIVPATEAKLSADVVTQGEPHGGERIATHVLVVQHSSASQMIPLLRPLMSPTSQISSYEPANTLIITDYADNIRRLLRIVEKIDQPVSNDVTIIALTHASALDLADLVTRLSLPGAGQPGQPSNLAGPGSVDRFTIVPDLRTNSLLVRADNPGRINQLRSLVEKLDVPAVRGGQTRVIYLRNADALKLAEVLRGLLAGEARAQSTAAPATALPGGVARPATAKAAEASLIQADEATNALIVNAPDAVYNNLRGVIEKLDVRRTQVYVEALIVEMSTESTQEFGFQWAGAVPAGKGAVGGVQNFPNANPGLLGAIASPTSLTGSGGLLLAYLGEKITLPDGTVIHGLGALARALESRGLANILSTPNLMTLDNAEAKIVVGQNVPFLTGSFAQAAGAGGAGGAVNPFQTIERKDVGLMLKIKPQVSEGGVVKLDISQEVSSVARSPVAGATDLVTNKRSIDTKVVVDDGHTIILGGLIEDNRQDTEQRVPLLGSIPLIGGLFRYKENTGKRTNLMIFLRPVIIHGPQDSYAVTTDRYQYLRGQARDLPRQDIMDRFKPAAPATDARPDPRRENSPTGSERKSGTSSEAPVAPKAATPPPETPPPAAD